MTGTEVEVIRYDGDNKPLSVDMENGIVTRPLVFFQVRLRTPEARRTFLDLVGLVRSFRVLPLIRACNLVAGRKRLTTDDQRKEAVLASSAFQD